MNIHNLTPHPITLEADGVRITIPPSGMVARVEATEQVVSALQIAGVAIPVAARQFGRVVGLPEADEPCIVSSLVLEAVRQQQPGRRHVYAPDTGPTAIRDEQGRIIAVRRLVGIAS